MSFGMQEGMGGFPMGNRVGYKSVWTKGAKGFVVFAGFGSEFQKE